jgi:hypothetical protein
MSITRAKQSSLRTGVVKYDNLRAGLPFTPTIGTATDGGTGSTVSVAFTANNTAGLTYTALSSPGSLTGTSTTSPITVSGLTSGTAYTFQVNAANSAGTSPYSAASNSVTPATPSSYESIASITPSGVNTITFSSIPGTYKSLQIRGICTDAGTNSLLMAVNGITSSGSYKIHSLEADGSSVTAATSTISTQMIIGGRTYGFSNSASYFAGIIIDIHDYASTTKNKTVRAFSGFDANGTAGAPGEIGLNSGLFINTVAVTSITLSIGSNFSSGTTFALYGIN